MSDAKPPLDRQAIVWRLRRHSQMPGVYPDDRALMNDAAEILEFDEQAVRELSERAWALLERGSAYPDFRTTIHWRDKVCELLRDISDQSSIR